MTPDVSDQPEDGEAMDDVVDDDEQAMMAMMGVSGFGTTKVRTSCRNAFQLILSNPLGKTCCGEPRRRSEYQKRENLAPVHE